MSKEKRKCHPILQFSSGEKMNLILVVYRMILAVVGIIMDYTEFVFILRSQSKDNIKFIH